MTCKNYRMCANRASTSLTCNDDSKASEYCGKYDNVKTKSSSFGINPVNIEEGSIPHGVLTIERGIPSWKRRS